MPQRPFVAVFKSSLGVTRCGWWEVGRGGALVLLLLLPVSLGVRTVEIDRDSSLGLRRRQNGKTLLRKGKCYCIIPLLYGPRLV